MTWDAGGCPCDPNILKHTMVLVQSCRLQQPAYKSHMPSSLTRMNRVYCILAIKTRLHGAPPLQNTTPKPTQRQVNKGSCMVLCPGLTCR
jgi:hypothetical protein